MFNDDFLAAPEIVRRLTSQDAFENETVTLTCTVQNLDEDDSYSIQWFFNEKELQSNEEKYSIDENRKTGICLLTIRGITTDDEGAYRCVATNQYGSAVTTGFLAVLRQWFISSSSFRLDEFLLFRTKTVSIAVAIANGQSQPFAQSIGESNARSKRFAVALHQSSRFEIGSSDGRTRTSDSSTEFHRS